jgi:hypothetical protein
MFYHKKKKKIEICLIEEIKNKYNKNEGFKVNLCLLN